MDQLLIILIAFAVGALVWTIGYVLAEVAAGRKRKIHQRLSTETRADSAVRARPILLPQQTTGLPWFLNGLGLVQIMQRRLAQAYPNLPLRQFLLLAGAAGLVPLVSVALTFGNTPASVIAGVACFYLPFFVVSVKRGKRNRQITQQLPDALDFLSRALRAGQSFSTGLQMMAEELAEPLAGEFRRCYDQHSLGQPLEEGLREMAMRLESRDVAFFATAVVIQRQSGGDMAEVLKNISGMVRQRLRLQQSVRAKTAEGRFTGYIMVAFPLVMFCIAWVLNPAYGNVLLHTSTGHKLLGVAAFLEIFGLFLIKRITTVTV